MIKYNYIFIVRYHVYKISFKIYIYNSVHVKAAEVAQSSSNSRRIAIGFTARALLIFLQKKIENPNGSDGPVRLTLLSSFGTATDADVFRGAAFLGLLEVRPSLDITP